MSAPIAYRPLISIVAVKQDAEWRNPIHAELEAQAGSEFRVWSRGYSLPPRWDWNKERQSAWEMPDAAVVVLSTRSIRSNEVRKEVERLQQGSGPLFLIAVEECEWREFLGAARTIFDEARPLSNYPPEIQREKIKEFARTVLAALRDEKSSYLPEPQATPRDHMSEEREGAMTRGEMTSEQQEEGDEARLREWRAMLSQVRSVANDIEERRQEGRLGREELAKVINTVANRQQRIRDWFETEEDLPEEQRAMISGLHDYETKFRQMLETLPSEPAFPTLEPPDGEVDEMVQHQESSAKSTDTPAFIIDLFSSSSRRVLGWADAFREKRGEQRVDIVHLIAALQQCDDDGVRDAFTKAGIDWPGLRLILDRDQWRIPFTPEEIRAESSEAITLPLLSDGADAAVTQAMALAKSENSAVLPYHLFISVFSIDFPITRDLQERGLRVALVTQKTSVASRRIGAPRGRINAGQDIPGVSSDVAKGVDLLGIEAEVAALCSVIAARDVKPPLSIGLFGDWGTGKSFFMEKMEEWIRALKKTASKEDPDEKSPFSSHIVQLKFNAWYYIDTNLWATLGSEIFRGLADALAADTEQPAQARERLLAATASQRDVLAEAEHRANAASKQLQQNEERLTQLASDEADIDSRLSKPSSILRAAYRVAVQDPDVQAQVREAAKTLNIPNVEAAATETKAQLMELKGIWGHVRATALAARRNKRIAVVSALAALLIIALLFVLTATDWWTKAIGLDRAMARIATSVLTVTAALAPLIKKAGKALAFIRKAQKRSVAVVDEEKRKEKEDLLDRKKKIQEEAVGLQKRVDGARTTLAELEQQLQELRADRQLSDFIKTRNESRDYTSHLGVIARARDDFQRLSNLLEEVQKQTEEERNGKLREEKLLLPRIDRIILYIDDLDRCPEDKVVDVLQAVHLLLAFPLFVVVVGVDSRWLLHSLKQHSRAFQPGRNGDAGEVDEEGLHWQSTPLNYLEKIFQIPFSLRPMESKGFGDLVDKLTEPTKFSHEKTDPAVGSVIEPQLQPEQTDSVGASKTGAVASGPEAPPQVSLAPSPAAGATASATSPPPANGGQTATAKVTAAEKSQAKMPPAFKPLNLSDDERNFMKRLHPLIPTPRAAKRFVNVYRLLRALNEEDKDFQGSKERAEHRAVLLLLAILTGHPSQGTEFLRDLLDGEVRDRSWWEFVEDYRSRAQPITGVAASQAEAERWRQFFEKIDQVRNDVRNTGSCRDFEESCDAFVKWAGQVARFSFQSARVALQRTSDEIPAPKESVTPAPK